MFLQSHGEDKVAFRRAKSAPTRTSRERLRLRKRHQCIKDTGSSCPFSQPRRTSLGLVALVAPSDAHGVADPRCARGPYAPTLLLTCPSQIIQGRSQDRRNNRQRRSGIALRVRTMRRTAKGDSYKPLDCPSASSITKKKKKKGRGQFRTVTPASASTGRG